MKKEMFRIVGLVFVLLPLWGVAQRGGNSEPQMTIPEYITKFSEIAKAEMRRSGIPASITLAQGILESNYGNSKLAMKANNHFGIKCGSNWKGPSFIQDDDTEKECFRKYESVLHSYADHSNFLRGKDRYASLFELNSKDYEGWAKGLQKAGYATNPNYSTLLIRLIDERGLHRFDTEEKVTPMTTEEKEYYETVSDKFYLFNGIKTVIAQPNVLPMDLATKYDVTLSSLLKYNDMHEGDYIKPGTKIFLEPKKSTGFEAFHRVDEGETMHSISQKEGIKLKALYKKNGMTYGQEAAEGEVLCLKKKCNSAPKLKTDEEIKADIKEEIQTRVDDAVKEKQKQEAPVPQKIEKPAEEIKIESPVAEEAPVVEERMPEPEPVPTVEKEVPKVVEPETAEDDHFIGLEKAAPAKAPEEVKETVPATPGKTAETTQQKYHTVGPQETLFKIATAYKLTLEELKRMNGITSDNISIGQRLIVSPAAGTVAEKPASEKPVAEKAVEQKAEPVTKHAPAATTTTTDDTDNPLIEEQQPIYHTVGPQETLYKIAGQYKVSVAELKVMNELTGNEVPVGKKLLVGYTGTVRTDPKEEKVAKEAVDVPEQKPQQSASKEPSYHKVLQGETLYSIAAKYKLNVEELKSLNKLTTNDIQPGRVLKLR